MFDNFDFDDFDEGDDLDLDDISGDPSVGDDDNPFGDDQYSDGSGFGTDEIGFSFADLNPFKAIANLFAKHGAPPKKAAAMAKQVISHPAVQRAVLSHPAVMQMMAASPAAPPSGRLPSPYGMHALQALRAGAAGGRDRSRREKLQFDSALTIGTVAGGAAATIVAQPQRPFRAQRLTISPTATNWLVDSFLIGVESQFVGSSGSIGGGEFDPLATAGANLKGDTAYPGITIALGVTNTTAGALRFTASLTGPAVT